MEVGVQPAALDQLIVIALFGDAAVVEDDDHVGMTDGRQAVRDDD